MKKFIAINCHKVTAPLIYTVNFFSSEAENIICLHVDSKANINDFQFLQKKNVFFCSQREDVRWGHFSLTKSALNMMNHFLDSDCDYFFLISGDDIPLINDSNLNEFLHENYGLSFVNFQNESQGYIDPVVRIRYKYPNFFFDKNPKLTYRMLRKIFPLYSFLFKNPYYNDFRNLNFKKGTNWFTLHKDAVQLIVDFLNKQPSYIKLFKYSFCSDEVFFHTILASLNSENIYLDPSCQNNAFRYVDWQSGPDYPKTLGLSDVEVVKNSGMHFARKIDSNESVDVMRQFLSK